VSFFSGGEFLRQAGTAQSNRVKLRVPDRYGAKIVPIPTAANAVQEALDRVRYFTARSVNFSHQQVSRFSVFPVTQPLLATQRLSAKSACILLMECTLLE
jgi:hypothetical protein